VHLVGQYGNETGVGKGIAAGLKEAGVEREDLFVTSKLYHTDHRAARVVPALKKTIADLNLNYIDCWMMHAPWAFEPKAGFKIRQFFFRSGAERWSGPCKNQ
jgi:alcohol dehydrogenase (NADP+)